MAQIHLVRHSYALIRHWIRRTGKRGDLLDEAELQRVTGASRTEVREALGALAMDGLVDRRRRAGTQLESQIADVSIDLPVAYEAAEQEQYRHVVLRPSTVAATPILCDTFGGPAEEFFLTEDSRIELNGAPLALRTSFWRGSERRRPTPVGIENADLAQTFHAAFNTELAECDAHIDTLRASERLAARLKITAGQPVLLREAVLTGRDGLVHEVAYTYYAGSRTSLHLKTQY